MTNSWEPPRSPDTSTHGDSDRPSTGHVIPPAPSPAAASQRVAQPQPSLQPAAVYGTAEYGREHRTDQVQVSGGVVAVAWVLAVLTFGYMLPWAVAASRGKRNHGAVALVNVLTGWTLIGWVVALVMACQSHQVVATQTVVLAQQFSTTPAGWYPAPDGPGQRYWDGHGWTEHRAP